MEDEIITGVDKLIQIIDNAGGRISVRDVMKKLNVSREIIEEWAGTLEESKAISIEYKFFRTYLVRGISKDELRRKAKELTLKEEAFKQNVMHTLKDFSVESKALDKLGDEFDKLSERLKEKSRYVEEQLKNLYEFDKLNKSFEEEKESVDKRTEQYMKKIDEQIIAKKAEYDSLLAKLDEEKKFIDSRSKKLQEFLENARKLNSEIAEAEERIGKLQEFTLGIRPEIEALEKKSVEHFRSMQQDAINRISSKQDAFIREIMLKRKFMKIGLEESQMIKEKIDSFFMREKRLRSAFEDLRSKRKAILDELNDIIRLAKEYKVLAKRHDISKQAEALKARYDDVREKKAAFRKELDDLVKEVSGKINIPSRKTSGKGSSGARGSGHDARKKSRKKVAVKKRSRTDKKVSKVKAGSKTSTVSGKRKRSVKR